MEIERTGYQIENGGGVGLLTSSTTIKPFLKLFVIIEQNELVEKSLSSSKNMDEGCGAGVFQPPGRWTPTKFNVNSNASLKHN